MKTPSSRIAGTVAGALALALGSTMMSSLAHPGRGSEDVDLTASAHPTKAEPAVTDAEFDVSSTWRSKVTADTSALASATCDDCRGDATAVQVIYAHDPDEVAVDNAAVAWSQCRSCGSGALSVQVVVVDEGRKVTANNRAIATNAACHRCDTSALAFQLVVVAPDDEPLSDSGIRDLRDWVEKQSRLMRRGADGTSRRPPSEKVASAAMVSLKRLVNQDLGSRTKRASVKRR